MNTKRVVPVVVLLCCTLLAAQHSIEELRSQAAAAKPQDQPKLYVEIAEQEIKTIEDLYAKGDIEQGAASLQQLALDCENAAQSSKTTRKHMKHTEIALRKISERLGNLQRNAAFDDRQPIKAALDRIEQNRTALLDAMFAKK